MVFANLLEIGTERMRDLPSSNKFRSVSEDQTEGAVTVSIWQDDAGGVAAEASFPPYERFDRIICPALGQPVHPPAVPNHAIRLLEQHSNLREIVVKIENRQLWNDDWGAFRSDHIGV